METVTTGCEGKLKNAIGGGVTKTRYKKKKKTPPLEMLIELGAVHVS